MSDAAGYTPDQARDAATPAEVLARIVEHRPDLRPDVAANPSTYPALLGWLAALGDPAVDAALRGRGQTQAPPPPPPAAPGPAPYAAPASPASAPYGTPATSAPHAPYGTPASSAPHAPYGAGPAQRATQRSLPAVPVQDIVRDGLAALLLLIALTLPWGGSNRGASASHIDVLLVSLVSLVSLGLPYFARAGVFPPGWTLARTRMVRLLAALPYVIVVVVYLTLTATRAYGSVGAGLVVGLAGAMLAAQPRVSELGAAQPDPAVVTLWRRIALGFLIAVPALEVVSLVVGYAGGNLSGGRGWSIPLVLSLTIPSLLIAGFPGLGLARRRGDWALALAAWGAGIVLWQLLDSSQAYFAMDFPSVGLTLVPAFAAIAASPALLRSMADPASSGRWIASAGRMFDLVLLMDAYLVVFSVLAMVTYGGNGVLTTQLVAAVLTAVAAVTARSALATNPMGARGFALGAAGLIALVGLVTAVVGRASLDAMIVATFLALPVAVAVVLLAPREVRETFAQAPRPQAFAPAPLGGSGPLGAPAPMAPAWTVGQALDPATSRDDLIRIVVEAPHLRTAVAANPGLDPSLVAWMRSFNDPQITTVLDHR